MTEQELPSCPGCGRPSSTLWCGRCARTVGAALVEIDRLTLWLEQQADGFAARTPGTYQASRSSASEAPSPAPLVDLVDRAYSDLVRIERTWRERQGYAASRRTSLGRTTHDRAITLAFLGRHLTSILREPDMIEHMRTVLRWRTVLRHYAHAEPERRDRPGRCPRCHMVAVLYSDDEPGTVRCRNCPVVLAEDEYQAEVVADPDAEVVPESRAALDVRPGYTGSA